MPHLTWYMQRPNKFKKEYKVEHPPDFEAMSMRNPLPNAEYHEVSLPAPVHRGNNLSVHNIGHRSLYQADSLINNTLGSLTIQPSTLLLMQMQHVMNLRELSLRQQLVSSIASNTPVIAENRSHSLLKETLISNLLNWMQRNSYR